MTPDGPAVPLAALALIGAHAPCGRSGCGSSDKLMAKFGKEERPEPVIAKIGHEVLAEMIGTTKSRVSF